MDWIDKLRVRERKSYKSEDWKNGYKTGIREMLEYFTERDNYGQYVAYLSVKEYKRMVRLSKEEVK